MTVADGATETGGQFEIGIDGGTVTAEVARTSAGLVISCVEVRTHLPSGVTHELLRRAPLGDLLAQARSSVELAQSAAAIPIRIPPPRHAAMTDDVLRDVARAYIEESSNNGRGATRRLQDRFDRPQGTIITWISRARKEGWLGPAARGRIGAEPGPRLLAWIGSVANCDTCHGGPPAGFVCRTCGAEGGGE